MKEKTNLDPIIHQPTRLDIIAFLYETKRADFNTIKRMLELSDGHMSRHMKELKEANYIERERKLVNEMPRTYYWLSKLGKERYKAYRRVIQQKLKLLKNND